MSEGSVEGVGKGNAEDVACGDRVEDFSEDDDWEDVSEYDGWEDVSEDDGWEDDKHDDTVSPEPPLPPLPPLLSLSTIQLIYPELNSPGTTVFTRLGITNRGNRTNPVDQRDCIIWSLCGKLLTRWSSFGDALLII